MMPIIGFVGLLFVSGAAGFLTSIEYGCLVFGSGLITFSIFGRRML